jgi:hypothetical protein
VLQQLHAARQTSPLWIREKSGVLRFWFVAEQEQEQEQEQERFGISLDFETASESRRLCPCAYVSSV